MKISLLFFAICLVSSSLGDPSDNSLMRHPRDTTNFIGNTKVLVEELIQNLRAAAQQALDAVKTFSAGLQDQLKQFSERIGNDLQKVRERVRNVIKNTADRFANAGSGVRNCIESHQKDVDNLFSDTVEKSKQCAGDRVNEIRNMIEDLKKIASNATVYANSSVNDLKKCTESDLGLISTGTCLSGIALRTELRAAVFLTRSGLLISRINLAFATLPAALDVCAGTKLVEAGVHSAKIVMEVGSCSASSIYSSLAGHLSPNTNV